MRCTTNSLNHVHINLKDDNNFFSNISFKNVLSNLPTGADRASKATGTFVFFTIVGSYNDESSNPAWVASWLTKDASGLSATVSKVFGVWAGKISALGADVSLKDLSFSSVCTTLFWLCSSEEGKFTSAPCDVTGDDVEDEFVELCWGAFCAVVESIGELAL